MYTMSIDRTEDYREAKRAIPGVLCMDSLQKEIFANMYFAACSYIGGLENTMSDYGPDTEDYQGAQQALKDHEELVGVVYTEGMTGFYSLGMEGPAQPYQRAYHFAGREWTRNCAEAVVKGMGY